ncbi:MAG: NeuD/PglB/VioB family sugar acetyltransferase [Opitutaceae bacterium]|nr:NeuD/PglB/VioB family sugar acetyltransferase [Opitutaceae bacterium]
MSALPGLVIIGAGGFGREMVAWAEQSVQFGRDWVMKGLIDDNLDALKDRPSPAKLLGRIEDYQPASDEVFICALGVPAIKRKCSELIAARGGRFTRVIHRTAVLGHEVELGEGVILCPHTVVSANNRLGRGVAVNLHASIDHDANAGDWSQINCHCDLTAAVEVGREVFMGSRVSVIPNVKIGDGAYLGAGAVVLRDVPAGWKVVGNPARRIG